MENKEPLNLNYKVIVGLLLLLLVLKGVGLYLAIKYTGQTQTDLETSRELINSLEKNKTLLKADIDSLSTALKVKDSVLLVLTNKDTLFTNSLNKKENEGKEITLQYLNGSDDERLQLFTKLVTEKN